LPAYDPGTKAILVTANTEISETALAALRDELKDIDPGPGEIAALVYVSQFVDRGGKTPTGFHPGYEVVAWRADQMHGWETARLSDGTELRFFPMFKTTVNSRYSIDVASVTFSLFSIDPAGSGRANQ
jgi:hypothetical protein